MLFFSAGRRRRLIYCKRKTYEPKDQHFRHFSQTKGIAAKPQTKAAHSANPHFVWAVSVLLFFLKAPPFFVDGAKPSQKLTSQNTSISAILAERKANAAKPLIPRGGSPQPVRRIRILSGQFRFLLFFFGRPPRAINLL